MEQQYFDCVTKTKSYSNKRNLKNYLNYFFSGVQIDNKKMLDVGGGSGLLSLWAAVNRCESICLEPEFDGSTNGVVDNFQLLKNCISNNLPARVDKVTIQDYLAQNLNEKKDFFDLVVMSNTINHINEAAVIDMHISKSSQDYFIKLFAEILSITKTGGYLIMTDCNRNNFFNVFGVKSPLMPTIEWYKHQSPYLWKEILKKAGYNNIEINWSTPNSLGKIGRILLGYRLPAFFLLSHFKITAMKP
jgi:SAM-dependent methyltransferase